MDQLKVKFDPFPFQIKHGESVLLLGSCFSEEMHIQFRKHGFNSISNPFGTVFHPAPLARFIVETLSGFREERIHQREDIFLSWDASSQVYAMSEQDLRSKLGAIRTEWSAHLASADYIFITLGTAWGYRLIEQEKIVANCHRHPQKHFEKILGDVQETSENINEAINAIRAVNEHVKIVFTVSPVRHSRDGLVENTRSKAVLHLVIQEMMELSGCYYFPSYEVVIDELRDYRFYTEDLVHPNKQAVNYLWAKLSEVMFSDETRKLSEKVATFRASESHKLMFPESSEAKRFNEKLIEEINLFRIRYPEISW